MTKHAPTQIRIAALAFLLFAAPAVFHSALGQQVCTQERAAGLAKKIIFEKDGTRHWHNCATKLGLYREVKLIQKLAK